MSRYTHNSPENNADRAAHRSKVEADGLRAEIARLNRQLIDGDAAMRDRVESLTEQVAQLTRERVARAVTWLVSAQTAGFRFQATDAVKCALEALRGS